MIEGMNKIYLTLSLVSFVNLLCGQTNPVASATPAPAVATAMSEGVSLPLSGWALIGAKDQTLGPKEESGKVSFGGEGFGTKGKSMAAFFPKTELGVGQTLRFKAVVRFTGVAGTGHFRYGIFQKHSKDHSRKWLGYCAYVGLDKAFPKGNLLARLPGNDGDFSGMKGSKGEEVARSLGESSIGIQSIKDGGYLILMELKRDATGIEVKATMDGSADLPVPMVNYSAKDDQPATTTFDAIGFVTHEALSTDSIEFSDISLQLQGP